MKKKWQHIIQSSDCPGSDNLQQYHLGQLGHDAQFSVEDHLAHCYMCTDELEGLSLLDDTQRLPLIEADLKQRLHDKLYLKARRSVSLYRRFALVASLLMLVGISVFIYHWAVQPPKLIVADNTSAPLSSKVKVPVAPQLDINQVIASLR